MTEPTRRQQALLIILTGIILIAFILRRVFRLW
jgi:hypothetical protein